jgi:hypothetical protein
MPPRVTAAGGHDFMDDEVLVTDNVVVRDAVDLRMILPCRHLRHIDERLCFERFIERQNGRLPSEQHVWSSPEFPDRLLMRLCGKLTGIGQLEVDG